jgi:DNA-binding HxlR family transcriptional regulator
MPNRPYGLICPISHACEILEPRWTIPILTELWGGATRFNDIRRGVGTLTTGANRSGGEFCPHGG